MKLAHLILTHAGPLQLKRLVEQLSHNDAHIYIHLDNKTSIKAFEDVVAIDGVHFIQNRVKVYWGGFSIVQATINGFKEILDSGHTYSHINLLSGQDYPIKPVAHIHQFLTNRPQTNFMHFLSVMDEWKEAIPRITRYHLANSNFTGKYRVEQIINTFLPKRKMPSGHIPMGRSQWFTITPAAVAYIVAFLKDNPDYKKYFMYSWAPDEMIFQTILFNSPFKEHMVNDNLLYVDWSAGGASPKVLTMADADALLASDKLFARKFSHSVDSQILDLIDSRISGRDNGNL